MGTSWKAGRRMAIPNGLAGRASEQGHRKGPAQKSNRAGQCGGKKEKAKENPFFQPYILRHTALTQLANSGCDVFTLAQIAGHSSTTMTQRYVHPQADAIERAFLQLEPKTSAARSN
jgi:integrase